jgi:phosphatidylserine/phosphatidylglycerophosphate/cardiolipin synthase-like enzyme
VIEKAILDALRRGVRVRILSNSKESIDEPMITRPILDSLAMLAKNGAEVYTKKVYGDETTGLPDEFYGNIGQSALSSFSSFTLDFKAMRFSVRGGKARVCTLRG